MTIKEIDEVIGKIGLANKFGDDIEAERLWLITALNHMRTMYGVAKEHLHNLTEEWREYDEASG